MANYDLSRLSVLFVEDSRFIRLLIRSVFLTIGLRQIHVANDGRQAIEIIKRLSEEQGTDAPPPIDLVISDLVMPGGDGFELLNWIRRDPESPHPFVAFALLTARADADVVAQSRNFGANEFIAKPFSANTIASRILSIINTPRQFILTSQYFGPDRRRQKMDDVDTERRVKNAADTETFHSQRAPSSLDMKEGRVCIFRLKNSLKERLSGGAGVGEIDPAALEAANEELANFAEDFAASASVLLVKLERTLNRLVETDENVEDHIRTLNEGAHELRGQGGIFGFALMTAFAKSLYQCTNTVQATTPMLLTIYKAHIDGMKVVLREEIEGAGGNIGATLLKSLEMAKVQHYAPK